MRPRVVITGARAVTPLGVGARALHARWQEGRCGIEDGVGRCGEFDPSEVMSSKDIRRSDRFTQLAITAAAEALVDAGWGEGLLDHPARIGCVIGTGIGGLATTEAGHDTLRDRGAERVPPLSVPMMMTNAATGVLAMRHGLWGQSFSIGSACAAGSHAIGVATRMIQADAGAAEAHGVDYVNAHGMSTSLNDRADKAVLGEHAGRIPVSSAKSTIGHLLGAAGTVESIATMLALRDRVAPPTLGYEQPDEGMDLHYVPGSARPLEARQDAGGQTRAVALSNSFGFGGHNAALCPAGAR